MKDQKPTTSLEAISRWVYFRDVVLTPEQEQHLQRILFADEKLRSRQYSRDQVITALVTRFGITQWRADKDISEVHKLFGTTRQLNKTYLLGIHLDTIQKHIRLAEESRNLGLLPKLNDNYVYALNSLPPEEKESDSRPAVIQFIIQGDGAPDTTVEELLEQARALLKNENHEYIPFDDQPDGPDGAAEAE